MLRISVIENGTKRQLVLEGKLVAPWTTELKTIGQLAGADGGDCQLLIDLRNVTAISAEGEDVLLNLMQQGARFRASGVYTRHVLKNLLQRLRLAKGTGRKRKVARQAETKE